MTEAAIVRRRPQRTAKTREAILDAAARILAEKGYEATSLEEVAIEAGIVRATVYYHFVSKESLYEAVMKRASAVGVQRVRKQVEAGGSHAEIFVRIIDDSVRETLDSASRYIHLNERVRTDPDARRRIRSSQREYVDSIADVIRAGQAAGEFRPGDPLVLTFLTIAGVGGLTRWYRPEGSAPPAEVLDMVVRIVIPPSRRDTLDGRLG